jgi:hypothetical protein
MCTHASQSKSHFHTYVHTKQDTIDDETLFP